MKRNLLPVGSVVSMKDKRLRDEEEIGTIVEQSPEAGEPILYFDRVFYNENLGSEKEYDLNLENGKPAQLPVYEALNFFDPFETGVSLRAELESKGLNVIVKESYSNEQNGKVLSQIPPAGTVVKKGDTIIIEYSIGPAPVAMPDLFCDGEITLEEATMLLKSKYHLSNHISTEAEFDDEHKEGVLLSQYPVAGEKIDSKTVIKLVYSTPNPTQKIPSVVGEPTDKAKNTLKKNGFNNISVEEIYDSDIDKGNTVRTSPSAGYQYAKKDAVVIYISKGPKPVKVHFDAVNSSITVYVGKRFTNLPKPPNQKGRIFSGWYKFSDCSGNEITTDSIVWDADEITLFADWDNGNCKVKYNSNGGSSLTNSGAKCNTKIGEDVISKTPIRKGYLFDCWLTEDGTEQVDESYIVPEEDEITLVAKWIPIKYTVKFNGGDGATGSMSSMLVKYDELKVLTTNGFSKKGYHFVKWKDNSGRTYLDKSSVRNLSDSNGTTVTMTAQWEPNTYRIVFNGNENTSGSTAIMSEVKYDKNYTLSSNGFKKDYWTFDGWATSSTGSVVYSDKASVRNLTTTNGATIYLYAKWKLKDDSNCDWVTSLPSGAKETQRKTQYRYRTSTTTWGSWSGWQESAVSSSSTRQVETKKVEYTKLSRWHNSDLDYVDSEARAKSGYVEEYYWVPSSTVYSYNPYNVGDHYMSTQLSGYPFVKRGTKIVTQYRYRDSNTTWGSWSAWQDSYISVSTSKQVETRTLYKYITK